MARWSWLSDLPSSPVAAVSDAAAAVVRGVFNTTPRRLVSYRSFSSDRVETGMGFFEHYGMHFLAHKVLHFWGLGIDGV